MSKIFLLGHRGFIGSHLLPKLQEANYEVITDLRYWNDRFDCIVNMAAVTHTRSEFDAKLIQSNIILPYHLFNRPERVVYASSCSARHNTNPYASSKIWSEFLGEKHGNALGLRFFNVFGEGNGKGIVWFLHNQQDHSKITIRGPELVRDYVHVDDVVNYIIRCIKPGGRLVDMADLRKYSEDTDKPLKEILAESKNGRHKHIDLPRMSSVIDVGSGVGTRTIDLVSLYCELSGKRFEIDTIPPDPSEPLEMVSNNIVSHIDLKTGLLKLINSEIIFKKADYP